jgi:hypothetical protein
MTDTPKKITINFTDNDGKVVCSGEIAFTPTRILRPDGTIVVIPASSKRRPWRPGDQAFLGTSRIIFEFDDRTRADRFAAMIQRRFRLAARAFDNITEAERACGPALAPTPLKPAGVILPDDWRPGDPAPIEPPAKPPPPSPLPVALVHPPLWLGGERMPFNDGCELARPRDDRVVAASKKFGGRFVTATYRQADEYGFPW